MTKIIDINFKDTSIEDIWTIDNATDGLKHICPIVVSNIYAYDITFVNGQSQTNVVNITQKASDPYSHGFAFGDPNDLAWYLYWDINDDDYTLTLWQDTGSSAEWYPIEIILKSNIGGNQWNQLLDLIYPIGSIYQTTQNNNPGTLFGGTWVQVEGVFLLGQSNTYTAGSTGGEATHILTPTETATKDHNHIVDHTHENNLSFSLTAHAETNCTAGTTSFGISNHSGTISPSTNATVKIAAHTLTQPVWKYTSPAHTHGISDGYVKWTSTGGYVYYYYASCTAWKAQSCGDFAASGSTSTKMSWGVTLGGSTGSGGSGTANNSTASRTTNLAFTSKTNHSITITQPNIKTPALSHSVSTQPVLSTPEYTHTVTKSGSITDYSGSTGTTTEANGSAHNNMPPYLAVYVWKRTA